MYPAALENFWLEKARLLAGAAGSAGGVAGGAAGGGSGSAGDETVLEKLRPAVQRLSDLFTTERPDAPAGKPPPAVKKSKHKFAAPTFPDYAADAALLAAYGLFFFPQSYERARLSLEMTRALRGWMPPAPPAVLPAAAELPAALPPAAAEPLRILDVGSGAGPCGLALADALSALAAPPAAPPAIALTALDHSPAALAALREITGNLAAGNLAAGTAGDQGFSRASAVYSAQTIVADIRRAAAFEPLPAQDLIVAGFSANELFAGDAAALRDWLLMLGAKLKRGGLLLILEPALRETSLALHAAAHAATAGTHAIATAGNLHLWAPTLNFEPSTLNDRLPAAPAHHPHEVRRWSPPATLEFLNRRLFREIGVLKFSFAALSNIAPPPVPAGVLRLVSPLEPLKGRLVCAVENTAGERLTLEVSTRDLSKHDIKTVAGAWQRGDLVLPATAPQILSNGALLRLPAPDSLTAFTAAPVSLSSPPFSQNSYQ